MRCKEKSKFWYGYKENVCINIDSGIINKIANDKGYTLKTIKRANIKNRVRYHGVTKNLLVL